MSTDILTKDMRERRAPVLGLAAVLIVLTVFALAIGAGLEDTITNLTESFPEALNAFMGAEVPGGYVVGEVFNLIAPLALVGYAVAGGARATAGEEEDGTMAVLAAQPVTRTGILASKIGGLLLALIAATVLFWASAAASSALFGIGLTQSAIAATCLHLLMLAVAFGALAVAVGAIAGRPSVAAAAAGSVAALSYITNAMLPLADLDGWARLSPWYYYSGSTPLANGLDPAHLLVLAALAILALIVAFFAFERRDLKG
ncbi:ABC transporter permease subunit [Rhodococcus spongiicola]|uniref:ABC transporter permease n=1 Tax=Rhodococcus spongiicola TaxID=2487352 RepID=A0A3S3DYC3_9NOCA|nr:ABC transporter permease [Rhodococcus spongiicola]RVW01797.1 ABC transporter permease [Rhodococcus spongiicola]